MQQSFNIRVFGLACGALAALAAVATLAFVVVSATTHEGPARTDAIHNTNEPLLAAVDATNTPTIAPTQAPPTPTPTPAATVTPTPTLVARTCGVAEIDAATHSVVRLATRLFTGSGFVTDGGFIVTNAHVVEGATSTDIQLFDGRTGRGQVFAVSRTLDIALIRPDAPIPVPALPWGDSTALRSSQQVTGIGFPLGATGPPTVTRGVVSRVYTATTGVRYVQTDAALNPGNSGGPLVDDCGRVIGVVTLKAQAEGIALAQAEEIVRPEVRSLAAGQAQPTSAAGGFGLLTGRWTIVDTVTFGVDSGKSFSFTVDIVQAGDTVTGKGSDISFAGSRTGSGVKVYFARVGGTGEFDWVLGSDGRLVGRFEDYGTAPTNVFNGGTSVATRQ